MKNVRFGGRFFCIRVFLFLENPLFVEGVAHEHVDDVCHDVGEERRLHELRNPHGEIVERPHMGEHVLSAFECREVEPVAAQENDCESEDFGALLVVALEIPDAVHEVAVDAARDEPEEIRKFDVPVQPLVQNPHGGERDERVHDADGVVFDKVKHRREDSKSIFSA